METGGENSTAWNVVAGRTRPRTNRGANRGARGGFRSERARYQPAKRQRVSTDSTGSSKSTSKADKVNFPSQTLEQFKSMSVDNKLETIFVCLQDMKSTGERLLRAERTVRVLHDTTQANKQRIDVLAYRSIDAESRQRRNNLIFWGIPESLNEDAMVVVSEFISDKLGIDSDVIFIQRAHRIGKLTSGRHGRGQSTNIRHRPLIAGFRDYPDVELIISNAGKLKGTRFGINRDYPQEIVDARKPLYKEKKELKIQNPRANIAIQYPAKLVMDGRVIRDMFPEWYSTIRLNRLVDNYPSKEKAKLIETDSSAVFQPNESSPFEDTDTDQDEEDLVCSMESQSILQNDAGMAGMAGAIPKSRQVQDTPSSKSRNEHVINSGRVTGPGGASNNPDDGNIG